MDKRKTRVKINAISTLANQLVATFCGILIPWVMIESFGSEAYGATTSIAQFLSYISLLEGGIGRAARGELYKPLAEGDAASVSRIFSAVKRFFRNIGIGFFGYAVLLSLCYYDIADVSIFTRDYIFWLVIAIAVGKFAEYMGGYPNITLFNADQRQYVSNITVIITSAINVLLVIILARSGCDLLWVKLGSSFVFVLKPIIYSYYRKKHYALAPTTQKSRLKNQWTAIGQHIAYFIQTNIAIFTLTIFADLKTVAVYSVHHLISFSLRNIVTSLGGGMEAMFGDMIAKQETDALIKTYKRYKLILTFLTLALFGAAMVLILPFIRLYTADVTDTNYIHPVFAGILLLSDAMYCLTLPCYNLPIAAGKLKESRAGAYSEAVVSVIVSTILVFWDPLIGVAVGAIAAVLIKSIYLIVFSGKEVLQIKTWKMLRNFAFSLIALVVTAVAGMWVSTHLAIYDYPSWIAHGFCVVLITGILAIVVCGFLYPKTMKSMIKGIQKSKRRTAQPSDGTLTQGNISEELQKHDIAVYAGYLENEDELLQCSSGGMGTALARQMLKRGGYVAGVSYSDDFREARYVIIDDVDQLDRLKGSKYTDARKGTIYRDVQCLLDQGKPVLFCGLPCVVAALRRYLGREYDHFLTVELICHGPTHAEVHRQYVEYLEERYHSGIVDFSVKRKDGAWTPGYLYAKFENGQVFQERFYHTEYGFAFSAMAKKPCYSCQFRGNNRTGDIMIGDFWGATEEDEFWNKNGVSAILVHTQKGDDFIRTTEGIKLFPSSFERVIKQNPNVVRPRTALRETPKFEKLFAERGLFYAVKHAKTIWGRAKAFVKGFLHR